MKKFILHSLILFLLSPYSGANEQQSIPPSNYNVQDNSKPYDYDVDTTKKVIGLGLGAAAVVGVPLVAYAALKVKSSPKPLPQAPLDLHKEMQEKHERLIDQQHALTEHEEKFFNAMFTGDVGGPKLDTIIHKLKTSQPSSREHKQAHKEFFEHPTTKAYKELISAERVHL